MCPPLFTNTTGLKPLFDLITPILKADHQSLIVIDDLSVVEWMGINYKEIHRFLRAILHVVRESNASIIIRTRSLSLETPSDLQLLLLDHCYLHIEVLGLSSGRSGAVSGEIAIHAGPNSNVDIKDIRPRHKALQYRLTEHNVVFFERGTSANVL